MSTYLSWDNKLLVTLLFLNLVTTTLFASNTSEPLKQQNPAISNDYKYELLPIPAVFFTPETNLGYGAMLVLSYYKPEQTPSTLRLFVSHTLKNQISSNLHWDHIVNNRQYRFTNRLNFRIYPLKYFGIGPENDFDNDGEDFTPQVIEGRFQAEKRLAPNFYGNVHYLFDSYKINAAQENGLIDQGLAPGSQKGTTSGLGLELQYDNRDHLYVPSSGWSSTIRVRGFDQAIGSDFRYVEYYGQHKHFFSLYPGGTLATNSIVTSMDGEASFRLIPGFGGYKIMRGYFFKRYRDKNTFSQQVELRQHVYWRFGMTVFGGVGNVAPDFSPKLLDDMKYNYGVGFRFVADTKNKYNLRADFGFKPESGLSPFIYVAVFEAF